MAPPACWRSSVSPRCGRGMPLAMCTRPSTPNSSAAQPMICRPAGPLLSGLRRLRQATKHSSSGTNQPSRPTEPLTTVRVESPTPPGSCHQTAAATTTASADQEQPGPVAPVLGLELAGGVPDLADGRAQDVGDAEPDRGDAPPEGESERGNGASAVADGSRCGALRLRSRPTLRRGLAYGTGCRTTGSRIRTPSSRRVQPAWRCPCSATPVGKTYGSPCWEIYTGVTPVPGLTRRVGAPQLGRCTDSADRR